MLTWNSLPWDVSCHALSYVLQSIYSPELPTVEVVHSVWLEWAERHVRDFGIYRANPSHLPSRWTCLRRRLTAATDIDSATEIDSDCTSGSPRSTQAGGEDL